MNSSILDSINKLSNERQALWLASGQRGGLTVAESQRVGEITAALPGLWEARRRELVSYRWML